MAKVSHTQKHIQTNIINLLMQNILLADQQHQHPLDTESFHALLKKFLEPFAY